MAHRALQELDAPGLVVALGGGSPADVAPVLAEQPQLHPLAASATFTTEAGVVGGSPQVGRRRSARTRVAPC
jgi:acyl CoA:acetate/3-ketoacid CoA transferase